MNYSISRYEKNLDHEGNIVSIFLAVSINNDTDSSYYEHWLSAEEMALVLADEANLKPILTECFAQAELKLENEVATRPMPTIHPLEEVGKKEALESLVKMADITAEKLKLQEEKLKEVVLKAK